MPFAERGRHDWLNAAKKGRRLGITRRKRCKPRIELLEEKLAPAVYTWTGAGGLLANGWSNTGNWQVGGSQPAACSRRGRPTGVPRWRLPEDQPITSWARTSRFNRSRSRIAGYDIFGDRLLLTGVACAVGHIGFVDV